MSKYEELMNFLDEGGDEDFESATLAKSSVAVNSKAESFAARPYDSLGVRSTESQSKRYIWDEDFEQNGDIGSLSSSSAKDGSRSRAFKDTYVSSLKSPKPPIPSYELNSKASDVSSLAMGSIGDVISEVEGKVEVMKKELEKKNLKVKDLQTEIVRLGVAKKKRIEKFQRQWETRTHELQEEQDALAIKQKQFYDRLSIEVKELSEKLAALKGKGARLDTEREHALTLAREGAQKKRERTRRQWEADERIAFEKVAQKKAEGMRKAAADSIGPKLDKLVIEGKEAVRAKADDWERKLLQIRHSLQKEMDEKLSELVARLKQERSEEEEKLLKRSERKSEETVRRQELEFEALKERFARERKAVEELAERTRRMDAESVLEATRLAQNAESKQVAEINERHQRDLAALLQRQEQERNALEEQHAAEEARVAASLRQKLNDKKESFRRQAREVAAVRAAEETERIIHKLRAEAEEERNAIRTKLEDETEALREQIQNRLDEMHASENMSHEKAVKLRHEVDSHRQKLVSLQATDSVRSREVAAAKDRLQSLRTQLHEVEGEMQGAEDTLRQQETLRLRTLRDERDTLHDKIRKLRLSSEAESENLKRQLEEEKNAHEEELDRVQSKVSLLLSKKLATLSSLRDRLYELRAAVSEKESNLESARNARFGASSSFLDDGAITSGVSDINVNSNRPKPIGGSSSGSTTATNRNPQSTRRTMTAGK